MNSKTKLKNSIIMFAPAIILISLFFLGTSIIAIYFSFTDITLSGETSQNFQFIGIENYKYFFTNPKSNKILINTVLFLLFSGILGQLVLGFTVAYLMQEKNKTFRKFVGLTIIFGWITPEVVAAFMFGAFFSGEGTLNIILNFFGMESKAWLVYFPLACVMIANVWKGSAYSMLMFQAALDNIPNNVLEAASIDGAGFYHKLVKIIIPMIKQVFLTVFLMITLGTLGAFGLIFMLTGGGPGVKSTTLAVSMYLEGFAAQNVGYGMSMAVILILIGSILGYFYVKVVNSSSKKAY